ncbi:MAG: PQQ-binding-like beta-propeller repeat protein [Acidobacteriota bacterium]
MMRPVLTVLFALSLPSVMVAAPGAESTYLLPSDGEGQQHWPRWRGPGGQGEAVGSGFPDRWSATENVRWKVPVAGRGNSSPILWRDKIFLTTAYDGGKRRSLIAFDRATGRQLWETFAPDTQPEGAHAKNGFASSTPTTDGERIYAYFGNHGLLAVDFAGKLAWHRPVGTFDAFHGTASSPLLHDGRLFLVQDHRGTGGSFVAAYEPATGNPLWRTPRQAKVGWNTPIAVRVGERDELIVSGQQQVQAYDPANGKELWTARGNTFEAIPTPVVGHGLLFASSGRGGPTLAIRPGGKGDVTDSHIVWQAPKGSPFVPSTQLAGDYLYMVNDMAAIATCYAAKSGEVVWQGRLGKARREGFSASPVLADDKVFFTNDEGETFVLATGPKFEILRVNELGENVLASPAAVDGVWYFRTAGHLLAIGHPQPKPAAK